MASRTSTSQQRSSAKPTRQPAKRAAKPRKAAATKQSKSPAKPAQPVRSATKPRPQTVKLLSGDNPQIAKGDGDAPVQAYVANIPGWKREVARRLDAVIERSVPKVRKAVRWNSPFYGAPEREGWFVSFHCYTHYIKVAFFRGQSLDPLPPGPSKSGDTRYVDVREGELDERQMANWVKQAAALPGEVM